MRVYQFTCADERGPGATVSRQRLARNWDPVFLEYILEYCCCIQGRIMDRSPIDVFLVWAYNAAIGNSVLTRFAVKPVVVFLLCPPFLK